MNAKEADGIAYLKGPKNGRYRYQRRVPKHAQAALGRKVWDLSLGSNYGAAVNRARELNSVYDDLLDRLATAAGREQYKVDMADEAAAFGVYMAETGTHIDDAGQLTVDPDAARMDRNPGLWRNTADKMKATRSLPPKQELEALAAHAAFAFGDRSTFDLLPNTEYHAALVDVMEPQRPTDAVDAAMFGAMKGALDARIAELAGERLVNPKHTLTYIQDSISELRNLKPNTRRNHKVTMAKFTKFLREEKGIDYELSLISITPDLLQEYLDYLLHDPDVKNGTISKYFDGMNSVFNHAIRTRKVPGLVVNPVKTLEMPRAESIEDTMFLPFDDAEIKRIWGEAQAEWDPGNRKSKLSAGRREAFLMVLRVLLWSGLRPVEAFWLRDHGEVTADYIDVQRTKTGVKRKIPICDHIADFPAFVASGGFDACIFDGLHRGEEYGKYNAEKLHEAMRRSFAAIRKRAKVTEPRKVLYSTKDTLLQRLRGLDGYSTPIEVVVTGHVKKLEMGRHYGGTLGDDPKMRAAVKRCLDAVTYW